MNGFTINKEKEKKQVYNWLTHKLADQSRKVLEKKKEDWKTRKEISRNER